MLLVFGDLHLDNFRRYSTILKGGINSRLNEQVEVVKKVLKLPLKDLTAIVFLGDLFNGQGSTISKQLYLVGYNIVSSLSRLAPLYLLVGNHDIYSSTHILTPFQEIPNVYVVQKTVTERLDGLEITMVPWEGIIPERGDVLLGHLDISGAKTGIGYDLGGTIHPKELEGFNLVISGHYHSRQWVTEKIHYCGAVMPLGFGDVADEEFGVTLLSPDKAIEFIPIPSPRFIPVIISSQEDLDTFIRNRDSVNYYNLRLRSPAITLPKLGYRTDVSWDLEEQPETRLDYTQTDSLEEILRKYILQCNTSIDKEEAIKILVEVLNEAN